MSDRDSIYAEMFNMYQQSLINFCISKGVRPEDGEDIVSEAFIRALEKADQLLVLEPNQQKAWLYSAVVNIIKENAAKASPIVFSQIENIENFIKDNDELERFQAEEDYQQYVQQVYDELSTDKERELFQLIFDKKINYEALSQKYNVTPGSVRVMVSRLRKKLREIVNKILSH